MTPAPEWIRLPARTLQPEPTERVFRLSKQLKTVESEVEADRVFQQAKAACEQHPLFGQWVKEVQEDVNCEAGLEEEERWVVWEQEPDEDLLCFCQFFEEAGGASGVLVRRRGRRDK